jgi:hypothetical protein
MNGWLIRIGDESQAYKIDTVSDGTHLALTDIYGGETNASCDFVYWPRVYTPASSEVAEVLGVVYNVALREVSMAFLNQLDPERESTGSPMYWRVDSKDRDAGTIDIEVYPPADEDYVVLVNFKKTVSDL